MVGQQSADASEGATAARRGARAATLLLGSSLTVMAGATVAPALSALRAAFEGTHAVELRSRLVLTLPALFIALASPLAGWVSDRFGRLRPLCAGLVLYALAGTSGLWLDSLGAILAGRALLGVAVALIATNVIALAGDHYQGAQRQRFLGLQASFMAFGGVVFLLLGGLLAELGWRAPFAVYLASLLLLPAVLATLRAPAQSRSPQAPGGAESQAHGWLPTLLAVCALAFVGMASFYMIPVQVPFLLEQLGETSTARTGLAIAANNLVAAAVGLGFGRLRRRAGPRAIHALHLALVAAGFLALSHAGSYAAVCAALALGGLGFGLLMPNLNTWLLGRAPQAVRARAVGALSTAIFLGQFASPLLVAPLGARFGLAGQFQAVAWGLLALAAVLALRSGAGRRPGG